VQKFLENRRQKTQSSPYKVKYLSWNADERRAWIEGVAALIVDMYIERENLQQELPIFEKLK
jgi:hypothetical protein